MNSHKHTGVDFTQKVIKSGVYTPTLTIVSNLDAVVAYECHYANLGNFVIVSGKIDVDASSAVGTETDVGISLPIKTTFLIATDCSGVFNDVSSGSPHGIIFANTNNHWAEIRYGASSTSNQSGRFIFTYKIQ